MLEIEIRYFDDEIGKIEKIDIGDWIDLRAAETVKMVPCQFKLIKLGIGMRLPKGYEAHVVPRSSTFKNFGIMMANSTGIVDESYCGEEDEWRFPAYSTKHTIINKGDRICQFRIFEKQPEVVFKEVDHLDDVSRGGFGSTGIS